MPFTVVMRSWRILFCSSDTLFFWEFCDAVHDVDVGWMWLVYDFWLYMMCRAGCHNYGNELLEMKAQFSYEFPELLCKVVECTWLVNHWGKKGQSIPTDLYLEHNNGFTKVCRHTVDIVHVSGANIVVRTCLRP